MVSTQEGYRGYAATRLRGYEAAGRQGCGVREVEGYQVRTAGKHTSSDEERQERHRHWTVEGMEDVTRTQGKAERQRAGEEQRVSGGCRVKGKQEMTGEMGEGKEGKGGERKGVR